MRRKNKVTDKTSEHVNVWDNDKKNVSSSKLTPQEIIEPEVIYTGRFALVENTITHAF